MMYHVHTLRTMYGRRRAHFYVHEAIANARTAYVYIYTRVYENIYRVRIESSGDFSWRPPSQR